MSKSKQIKAVTDFGIVEVKTIGAIKEIFGEMWVVAEVPFKYMNSAEPLLIRKVLHYKTGGSLPIKGMPHNAPAKDYITEANYFLSKIPKEAIKAELNKLNIINQ